jgi:type IV pilus assembly protein PilX
MSAILSIKKSLSSRNAAFKQVSIRAQRGVVLVISLIVLVAMGLAGIAMVRQLSGGLGVAGNLAFKQGATSSGDAGLERALVWLKGATVLPEQLNADIPAESYFSSWNTAFNPLTYDWKATNASKLITDSLASGEKVRYVVHRLCSTPGPYSRAQCVVSVKDGDTGGSTVGLSDDKRDPTVVPYYRITARVEGPRNTISYVQMMMF